MAKEDLLADLQREMKEGDTWGQRYFYFAHITFFIVIFASIAAAVLVVLEGVPKWLTALIAVLPGVAAVMYTTLKFEERAFWFWQLSVGAEQFVHRLRDQGAEVAEVSKGWDDFRGAHESKFPRSGQMPDKAVRPI